MDSNYTDYIKGNSAAVSGGKLWVASNSANVVCAFSLDTYAMDEMIIVQENSVNELFSKIISYDNYMFLIPDNANNMWRINTDNDEIIEIDIGLKEEEKGIKGKFKTAYLWNNRLHLFGHEINACIEYDLDSYDYKRINYEDQNTVIKFSHVMATDGRFCYLPVADQDMIVKYDCDNRLISYINVDFNNVHTNFATVIQNHIIFSISDDSIMLVNLETMSITTKKMRVLPEDYKNDEAIYRRIIRRGETTIIIPSAIGELYFSHDDKDYESIKLDDKSYKGKKRGFSRYEFDLLTEDKLYIQSRVDGEVYEIKLDDLEIIKHMPFITKDAIRIISSNIIKIKNEPIITEEVDIGLSDFIGFVANGNHNGKESD